MDPLVLIIFVGIGGIVIGAIGAPLFRGSGKARPWAWVIGVLLVALALMIGLPLLFLSRTGGGSTAGVQPILATQVASVGATVVVRESVVAATPVGPQQERLIIRNGQLVLIVEDTRATQHSIEQGVAEMAGEGAFVVSSSERVGPDQNSPYISLHIRIPVTRFDEVIDRLAAMAVEVRDRNETAQDVTEEYVDLQARLESLEAARQRLLEIMQAAQTTEDLLLAEQQLTQREAEIESIKGRLQYLAQSAQLSSITIELWPYLLSQPLDTRWRPAETAREAFETLVNGLRSFGDFVIFVTIAVLPWLALGGLVVYAAVRLVRRWRKPQSKPSAE